MDKKTAHTKAGQNKQSKYNGNDAYSQCMRLLDYLCLHDSVTTIEARRDLDIMMPATRIFELREMGYRINTLWTQAVTESGRKHRIGRYVLLSKQPVKAA